MSYEAGRLLIRISAITKRQCVETLRGLLEDFQVLPMSGILEQVQYLNDFLNKSGIICIPSILEGDLDTLRSLVFATETSEFATSEIASIITEGEGNTIEFKSTFFVDTVKVAHSPNLDHKEYRSDKVILSAMKTIAAFLNCDGGTLLIGITDEGKSCGLKDDHILPNVANEDKWQLTIRSHIESHFKDGKSINAYISINILDYENERIAVFRIMPRPFTAYLKSSNDPYSLYIRNGNRTDKLDVTQAEDYFRAKWDRQHVTQSKLL